MSLESIGSVGRVEHGRLAVARRGYLQAIDTEEVIATVRSRRAPMMSATAGLCL